MGQAKQRGTFEERKQQAVERNNKKYAAQMLQISGIKKSLIENKDNINPVLVKHRGNRQLVLAIAAALSSTTGVQFHLPPSKEEAQLNKLEELADSKQEIENDDKAI